MANSRVQGLSLRTRVHVMTIGRTTTGVNKTEPSAQGAGKSVPPIGCSESSQRRWRVISHFVAGSARRPCATEVQQHFSMRQGDQAGPVLATRRWLSKAIRMRLVWLSGSIRWVLLAWG